MKILLLFLISFNCFAWSTGVSVFPKMYGNKDICEKASVKDCIDLFDDISIYKVSKGEIVIDKDQESEYREKRRLEVEKESNYLVVHAKIIAIQKQFFKEKDATLTDEQIEAVFK